MKTSCFWLAIFSFICFSALPAQTLEMVSDINPTGSSDPQVAYPFNGKLYFLASDGTHGRELWHTDGTAANTDMLLDINPGGDANCLFMDTFQNRLFFQATDPAYGKEIWWTDGTAAGTEIYYDFNWFGNGLPPWWVHSTRYNGKLYLHGYDPSNTGQILIIDGTPSILDMLFNAGSNGTLNPLFGPVVLEDKLFFVLHGFNGTTELWSSDGTDLNTQMFVKINDSPANPDIKLLRVIDGKMYFTADDGIHGRELWVCDGTPQGTHMVLDINLTGESVPYAMFSFKGKIFFIANDGVHGSELWVTDGTAAGTQLFKDIDPAGSSGVAVTAYNSETLYLIADDGTHGRELWISDGTPEGTLMVVDLNPGNADGAYFGMMTPEGEIYFRGNNGISGWELWVSEGTSGSTQLVQDINPAGDSNPGFLHRWDGYFYLNADDGVHGKELWRFQPQSSPVTEPEIPAATLRIFPNPAFDHIRFEMSQQGKILVRDMLGRTVKTVVLSPGEFLDISALPAGQYSVYCPDEDVSGRFVKQ